MRMFQVCFSSAPFALHTKNKYLTGKDKDASRVENEKTHNYIYNGYEGGKDRQKAKLKIP